MQFGATIDTHAGCVLQRSFLLYPWVTAVDNRSDFVEPLPLVSGLFPAPRVLARSLAPTLAQELVLEDRTAWIVVALTHRRRLAVGYR